MAWKDWLMGMLGSSKGAATTDQRRTQIGHYSVILYDPGEHRAEVRATIRMLCPLNAADIEERLARNEPIVVREGLTDTAARSIARRLLNLGAVTGVSDNAEGPMLAVPGGHTA